MFTCSRILIFFGAVIACSSCATAFFINWGSPDTPTVQRPIQAYPVTYYHQRLLQTAPQSSQSYVTSSNGEPQSQSVPAIPIQVPLQAQLSPINNVHSVQLVPCLCPVSSELEYDRTQEAAASSVFVSQINKNPQDA